MIGKYNIADFSRFFKLYFEIICNQYFTRYWCFHIFFVTSGQDDW